jgi:hypothetical protein
MASERRGELGLPTLGWWRSTMVAGDDDLSSSFLGDDVWAVWCTSDDGEITQGSGGLGPCSWGCRLSSRRRVVE